jgi:hypothetical protein
MKALSEEYMECIDSFLAYSDMVSSNALGPSAKNYIPYQMDVLECLVGYQIKIESYARISQIYKNSVSQERIDLDLSHYMRAFVFRLKKSMPFLQLEQSVSPNITISVYREAWDEIFNILFNFFESLTASVNFNSSYKIEYDENAQILNIMCRDQEGVRPSPALSNSNDNYPLPYFNFAQPEEVVEEEVYLKNTIDDPNVADDFINEEVFHRSHIKYILEMIVYIAHANKIVVEHSFEAKKLSIKLVLEKCHKLTLASPNQIVIE